MTADNTTSKSDSDPQPQFISGTQPSRLSELFVPWLFVLLFVVVLGLLSPLRIVAAGALLSAGAVMFLPFVVIAAVLAVIFMSIGAAIIGPLLGVGGAAPIVDDGGIIYHTARNTPRFYGWLLHKDRTWIWGAMLGAVTGAALLGVILVLYIIPREGATAITLIEIGDRIKHIAPNQGGVPRPDNNGYLSWEQLVLTGETSTKSGVVKDGFGRPIVVAIEPYTPPQFFKFAFLTIQKNDGYHYPPADAYEKFILTSEAFGSLTTKDDLVHSDIAVIDESEGLSAKLKSFRDNLLDKGKASLSDRVDALKALRSREKKSEEES